MKRYTSAHWGVYAIEGDFDAPRLSAFSADPNPSAIGLHMVDAYRRARVARPSVRKSWLTEGVGAKPESRGLEPFVEVDWSVATEIAARALRHTISRKGNRGIFGGSYGWASAGRFHHAQSQVHRFLNCIGGYVTHSETYSLGAGRVILQLVLADSTSLINNHHSWDVLARETEIVVAFGGIPEKNGAVQPGGASEHLVRRGLQAMARRGARLINISPVRSSLDSGCDVEWIPLRPGSDTAFMLGLAHTLVCERKHDIAFLNSHCIGFERFEPYLLGTIDGQPKDADWASQICQVPAARIRALALEVAGRRTLINVAFSLQRADHGEQPFWMGIVLAAMLGQIGLPGGGFGLYGASNQMGATQRLLPAPTFPQGTNPVAESIPVARIADMLEHPGETYRYRGETRVYPEVEALYWAGGNPFHHHQDLNRFLRAWRRPRCVIVNEQFWTVTAKMADIVFPVTSTLEREDLGFAARQRYMVAMRKAMQPYGESKSDYEIFSLLAASMGVGEKFTEGRDESAWLEWMHEQCREAAARSGIALPGIEDLRTAGVVDVSRLAPSRPIVMLDEFRRDPAGAPLSTPSGRIEIFSDLIDSYACADCRGHPTWEEPKEWLGGEGAMRFPLHMLSDQPREKLHSQLDQGPLSLRDKVKGRQAVQMNDSDAAARGIRDGDLVRIYNDRGACLAGARTSNEIMSGVVKLSVGAWFDPEDWRDGGRLEIHGNPNVLTPDRGSSELSQGCSAQSCLVEVERYSGPVPRIAAFDAPPLEQNRNPTLRRA